MKIYLNSFLVSIFVIFGQNAFAGFGTNSFFVNLHGRGGLADLNAIDDAKTNVECQPAENDLAGHWGEKTIGEQLSIRFAKDVFKTNESVVAIIIYRNTRTDNDLNCSWVFGEDLDFKFIIKDESGNELSDRFVPQKRVSPVVSQWPPGTQYKYESNLTRRYGLSTPGIYSVSVQRKAFAGTNGWAYVASGTATIKIK